MQFEGMTHPPPHIPHTHTHTRLPPVEVEMATVVHTLDHDNVRGLYTRRRALSRQASQATRAALGRMQAKATDDVAEHLINVVRANVNLADVASPRFAELFIGLCKRVAPILEADDRVVELRSPVHVFGDLHGNLDDLRFFCNSVWPLGMKLTAGKFLFLGDFVDRGEYRLVWGRSERWGKIG